MSTDNTLPRIHALLARSYPAVCAALLCLYRAQTAEEKYSGQTKLKNGVGFNGADSAFLTSLATQLERGGTLSSKQLDLARKLLYKYARQLVEARALDHLLTQETSIPDNAITDYFDYAF